MQQSDNSPFNIQSCEGGEEGEESPVDRMDPNLTERETLLPPRPRSPDGSIYREPKDRFNLVFIIFLYLGVATLLPWNFFITAKHYFDFKFRNTSLPDDVPYNVGNVTTDMQKNIESYLSIMSMASNLIFITLAMIFVRNVSINVRMLISLLPIIAIFITTVVFVVIDTDSWQQGFFWLTLVSAAFMVGLTAVMTGSVFGLSCLFPPRYTQAVMAGQAVGGTLSAVVNIAAIAIGEDPISSAFGFFLTAAVCSALALVAYFSLYYLKYSKFYMANQPGRSRAPTNRSDEDKDADRGVYDKNVELPSPSQLLSRRQFFAVILKKMWPYFLTVCLVFLVTLACFPAIVSLITSVNYTQDDPWTDTFFSPVVCFLLFNVCDLLGRTATHFIQIPRNGQTCGIVTLACLRLVFIPLFMMCNIVDKDPHHKKYLPDVLQNDAWPIVLNIALGLSNGYLGTLSMLHGPSQVDLDHAEGAGMVMTFGMTLGLASGSVLSLLLVKLV
ncbi:equilibrative nucleoside transporter 3-like isoform X3 [Babylonia areolata]|uniref:equilibrative nucleoside transporter 3-like isoform X3 n=1 Tax=Babylonia areolata TaxID=304850 RepID=UPI003FD5288A